MTDILRYGLAESSCCEKVKNIYKSKILGRKPKVYIKTYGCQQNVSDSEKYLGIFLQMGFDVTENQEKADVVLFNTCAIRENAENKAFGNLGWIKSLKDNNKNLFVIVCGCMTEQKVILDKVFTPKSHPLQVLYIVYHLFEKIINIFKKIPKCFLRFINLR